LSEKLNTASKQLAGIQEERRELQETSHKLNLSVKGCEREKKELQDRYCHEPSSFNREPTLSQMFFYSKLSGF
jgi:hypothetical protein